MHRKVEKGKYNTSKREEINERHTSQQAMKTCALTAKPSLKLVLEMSSGVSRISFWGV